MKASAFWAAMAASCGLVYVSASWCSSLGVVNWKMPMHNSATAAAPLSQSDIPSQVKLAGAQSHVVFPTQRVVDVEMPQPVLVLDGRFSNVTVPPGINAP